MRRGTTPTITATVSGVENLSSMSQIWLTFRQKNTIVNKTKSQMTIDGSTISVELTQAETLEFTDKTSERGPVYIQVRGLTTGGDAWASDIRSIDIGAILKDGAIS